MSTSDVIRLALDTLLRGQPPEVIAEHRRYAEEHYMPDLDDDPVAQERLRYALERFREPAEEQTLRFDSGAMAGMDRRVDSSTMGVVPRFDSKEIFGETSAKARKGGKE